MEQRKSQFGANMTMKRKAPMPEQVRQMFSDDFEPKMVDKFGNKADWNPELVRCWDLFKLAALQATVPEVNFYNESNEREDDL